MGCRKCIPKNCNCAYIGRHCDLYVWVMPEDRDELAKLTFAILDYATNDPKKPQQHLKEVTWFLDSNGSVTADPNYAGKVVAIVDAKDPVAAILNAPTQVAKNDLRTLRKDRGVTLAQLKANGPFKIPEFSADDQAKVVQLLAELKQTPAQDLLSFLDNQSIGLWDVIDKKMDQQLDELRMPADNVELLKGHLAQFAPTPESFKATIKELNANISELPKPLRESRGGLESLDLQEERGLTPIFTPGGPSRGQADNILQLRQDLNTVIMPQSLAP